MYANRQYDSYLILDRIINYCKNLTYRFFLYRVFFETARKTFIIVKISFQITRFRAEKQRRTENDVCKSNLSVLRVVRTNVRCVQHIDSKTYH